MEDIKVVFKCDYNEADVAYLKEFLKDVLGKGTRRDRGRADYYEEIEDDARKKIKEIIKSGEVEVEIFKYWPGDKVFFKLKGMDNSFILRYTEATMGITKCKIVWDLYYSIETGSESDKCAYSLREWAESKIDKDLFKGISGFWNVWR